MNNSNIFHHKHKVPTFDDINNDSDDGIQYIGDVHPSDEQNDGEQKFDQVASISNPSLLPDESNRNRYRCGRKGDDDGPYVMDPTSAHVKRGLIYLPVEMKLPSLNEEDDTPTYSMTQSRISLYAAFPPPPIIVQPINSDGSPMYSKSELNHAQHRLKQHSGFYTAMCVTSATCHSEGYADTVLSLNYRQPSFISWPSSLLSIRKRSRKQHEQKFVGNMHYNIQLGCTPKTSCGYACSSLDGKTHVRFDVGNPFSSTQQKKHRIDKKKKNSMILVPSTQSDYTISASHDFFCATDSSLRASWMMKLSPLPSLIFTPTTSKISSSFPLHMQYFNMNISTIESQTKQMHGRSHSRPRLSLSLGYGTPLIGGEGLWMSNIISSGAESSKMSVFDSIPSPSSLDITNVTLDVEHEISSTQSCHSTIGYSHTCQLFSFGTIFTRKFSSSRFSRLGIGIRQTFGNIFCSSKNLGMWWKQGTTSWLFQLERGDVRFLVPVTICPKAVTAWDLLLRLMYATITSIVADIIVSELFCGVTSKLRLKFLRLLLGDELVGGIGSSVSESDMEKGKNDEEHWLQNQLLKTIEDTKRQVNLMQRQAKAVTVREKEQGGLVIVKAVYGVMDNESRQWIKRDGKWNNTECSSETTNEMMWHTMDATTQLQFWVADSSLHLPALSKKHMLGFYDLMAFVTEDEWTIHKTQSLSTHDMKGHGIISCNNFTHSIRKWWSEMLLVDDEQERDLVLALSVRYKWNDKLYDALFYDEDPVDLP